MVERVTVQQAEKLMVDVGEDLYNKVMTDNQQTQALWFSIRNDLANLRVEIVSTIAEAASIPWELMRDPQLGSPIALRVKSFVRLQSNPSISFVPVRPADDRIRLLYIASRPSEDDVELRVIANRLVQDLGQDRSRFDIKALRPPTFERLQQELADAKQANCQYHIVHFDGHGIYADLHDTSLADWASALTSVTFGGEATGKRGYVIFEHASEQKIRPIDGQTLGQLLHDCGVPVLVLNACQSAMHEATAAPKTGDSDRNEARAIGSFAQAVVDQGVPAVLGMRYSVYVVTAAQYVGQLYAALAKGRSFGESATEGRKHLHSNPDRWLGLQPRLLRDWPVPVVYEAVPIQLLSSAEANELGKRIELDPVHRNRALLRYVPEEGFIGRDETILAVDRAFDRHRVVLLHAYAGQGKTSTAVEFARWYCLTGGLGEQPLVLLASFENHLALRELINQVGRPFATILEGAGIHWGAANDETRRDAVLEIFRRFPILWIWDNVEPVAGFPADTASQWTDEEQADLRDFLHQIKEDKASKVKILITSRREEEKWLGRIPYRISMRRMSASDAAKVALKLGQEKNISNSEIADWQPLIDYCAGNPLTLRVLVGQAVAADVRGSASIAKFVAEIRTGERQIDDTDAKTGRDKSLGASLAYGFSHAFNDAELRTVALLHLFQGTVNVMVLEAMGQLPEHKLPELQGATTASLLELLKRTKEVGLLTQLSGGVFTIHPALPWFLADLFTRHYDGQAGRSTALAALRAWVEAMGELGNACLAQYDAGNREVTRVLSLEEANLFHARHVARRQGWWHEVVAAMQGLQILYEYHGRQGEWSNLVAEITRDFCDADDGPVAGREREYPLLIAYRLALATNYARDFELATKLQRKLVEVYRQQAAPILALPPDAPLDGYQRNCLRSLGQAVQHLGVVLFHQESPECVEAFKESIVYTRRIEDRASEAMSHREIGLAYMTFPAVLNLDAAEAAFEQSLALRATRDALGRSRCLVSMGQVHAARLNEAMSRNEPEPALLRHAQAALDCYRQSLQLCPKDSLPDVAHTQNAMGNLYQDVGDLDNARPNYEQARRISRKPESSSTPERPVSTWRECLSQHATRNLRSAEPTY